jgi:hypothetical protein
MASGYSIFLVGVTLLLIFSSIFGSFLVDLDVCFIDRKISSNAAKSNSVFITANIIILISAAIVQCINMSSGANIKNLLKSSEFVRVLYSYLWYLSAYFLCEGLKYLIGDNNCNIHSNSVSGHYLFHVYNLLTLFHLHAIQTKANKKSIFDSAFYRQLAKNRMCKLFLALWAAYTVGSIIILYQTYFFGFHSMRQIVYGLLLAISIHWILIEILELMESYTNIAVSNICNHNITHFAPIQRLLHFSYHFTQANQFLHFNFIPLICLFMFQAVAFIILALVPAHRVGWNDFAVVAVGWVVLLAVHRAEVYIATKSETNSPNKSPQYSALPTTLE